MKRWISAAMILCVLLGCLLPCAAAAADTDTVKLRLHSDVAGCTEQNVDCFLEILSPQVVGKTKNSGPVSVDDAASSGYPERVEAGRTYYVTYSLIAADGYTLPETIDEVDLSLDCGKGVSVIYSRIVDYYQGEDENGERVTLRTLEICAKLVVDGSVWQRIVGWVKDVILRIRSWQLY